MENQFYQAFDVERRETMARNITDEYRTPFQIDRDRIIHTSAFRRLQNKTQVFLSGEYDFYRTRLTHSIEVAQIGRSLCSRLKRVSPHLGEEFFVDPDLVEAACLAHDIGHPPFGHTGEKALHRLMERYGGFEGNAQTLRILSQTIYGTQRGMNPTRALVDAVLKYKTLYGEVSDQKNHFLYQQQSDWLSFVSGGEDFPEDLPPGKERNSFRSIECQIMDWADDTAYSLNDIADGIHAGFLTCEKIGRWAELKSLAGKDADLVEELLSTIRKGRIESFMGMQIGDFIAAASLEKSDTFLSDRTNRHRFRLVIDPEIFDVCSLYKKLSVALVFHSRQLQQLDRKSDFILSRLFGVFSDYYIEVTEKRDDHFQLFDDAEEELIFSLDDSSDRARVVCDILARMTDGAAGRTYKRLFDAEYGSIVDLA